MPRGPRESQMGRVTVCDSARRFVPCRPGAIERGEHRAVQAKIEDGAPRSRSVPGSRSSGVGVWLDGAAAHPCPAACAVRSIGARCRPAPPATTPDRWYRTCPRAGVRDQIGLEFAVKLLVGAMVRIHAMILLGRKLQRRFAALQRELRKQGRLTVPMGALLGQAQHAPQRAPGTVGERQAQARFGSDGLALARWALRRHLQRSRRSARPGFELLPDRRGTCAAGVILRWTSDAKRVDGCGGSARVL